MPRISSDTDAEVTLDSPPDGLLRSGQNTAVDHHCQERCAQLVEGTGPHLSSETASVLRVRLRAASICLFVGFGLFLLWGLVAPPIASSAPKNWLFYPHLATTLVLAIPVFLLCRKCEKQTLPWLRLYELMIFGIPALFFVLLNIVDNYFWAKQGMLDNPMASWFLLIFTYALFIPNTWKRALAVLVPIALTPVVVGVWMYFTNQTYAEALLRTDGYLIQVGLQSIIALVVAVYGVHTIGTLRREAFEARQLGQYRLLKLIGAGGMGEVYLAEHQMMKRPCALKLIRPGKATDPKALARFEREVRATSRLSHWNSVEVFDYGRTDDGTFYYVMEYLPGLNLSELVDRHGPLPAARMEFLIAQACDALEEAHSHGVVHRDLKPGNLFAAKRGGHYDVAKLLDFGLAKTAVQKSDIELTQEGSITGSPLYMSPEQAMGDNEPDVRGDIYSLGAVMYFLLTGRPPFPGDRPMKVILAHVHQEVEPPSQFVSDIPPDIEQIVLRCLAKDPKDRFQSAAELRDALESSSVSGLWDRVQAEAWWHAHSHCRQAEELLAAK